MKNRANKRYGNIVWLIRSSAKMKLRLRRSVPLHLFMAALLLFVISFTACEKNIDLKIDNYKPMLIVEAYINNQITQYNYVVLSRSLEYFSTDFQSIPVSGASVFITEGEVKNNQYVWNTNSKVKLTETNFPDLPKNFKKGVYFDPRVATDPTHALTGRPGKSYLLEITEGGHEYSAIATMLTPVPIDSLTLGQKYVDESDSNRIKYRITNHYKDPDTLNNTQFYYYRYEENRKNFGWGGISKSRAFGTDDLTNGEQIHLTHSHGFALGDTVNYHMASVTRDVYNFWDSFNKVRNNGGPFSTPIILNTNIKGDNVTGCFSGLSLSSKTIIIR